MGNRYRINYVRQSGFLRSDLVIRGYRDERADDSGGRV
jgi:hypothetical protein